MLPSRQDDGNSRAPALACVVCVAVQAFAVARMRWWSFYRQSSVCPHPSSTDSLRSACRATSQTPCCIAPVFFKLRWLFRLDLLSVATRRFETWFGQSYNWGLLTLETHTPLGWSMRLNSSCDQRQLNLLVFPAGSLLTVRSVKYGVSSLMDSSARVCISIQYSVLAGTTKVNLHPGNTSCNFLEAVLLPQRQSSSSRFTVTVVRESASISAPLTRTIT